MQIKKVGIITLYDFYQVNYGNKFQNYACEKIYEKLGYKSETLIRERPFSKIQNVKYQGYRLLNALSGYRLSSKQQLWKRYILFGQFERKFLHIRYVPSCELVDTNYDYYSIGSDQVWNPTWIYRPNDVKWYYCADVPAKKCICLSPSFGINSIPEEKKREIAALLSRFESISVREERGRNIIKELTGEDAEVLIDPTLALSKEEWDEISHHPEYIHENTQYILCYFLGGMSDERRIAFQHYADRFGLQILDLMDPNSKLYAMGPSEFMWILAHSEAVFTDSFHGSVFSIIYKKPLFVYKREGINNGMFSRLETLLKTFQMEDRIVYDLGVITSLHDCDYTKTYEILKVEQDRFWDYLKKSLNRG